VQGLHSLLAAYPEIVRTLKKRGYRFETVPQLLGFETVYQRRVKHCHDAAGLGPLAPGSIIQK
jgi:hypothetical protein